MKLIVKNKFRDKDDHVTVYDPETILEVQDKDRAADLVKRGLCAEYKGKKAASVTLGEDAAETPDEGAAETPDEGAAETPDEGAAETPDEGAAETPEEGAAETPDEGAAETSAEESADAAGDKRKTKKK